MSIGNVCKFRYKYILDNIGCLTVTVNKAILSGNYHYNGTSKCPDKQPYFLRSDGAYAIFKLWETWRIAWPSAVDKCASGAYETWSGKFAWQSEDENMKVTCTGG